jgi:RimJ/RimL family protein N-acetyltransferase
MGLDLQVPNQTARLTLRPLREADVHDLYAYHSSAEVHRFLPMPAMDAEALAARIIGGRWSTTSIDKEGDAAFLGAELRATGVVVGDLMLRYVNDEDKCGEIGYVFNPEFAGQGLATEAAHAVLHLAFDELGLHRMVARIDPLNDRSRRLAERLSMRLEAHLIKNCWMRGEWLDEVDYAILEEEFAALHDAG